MRVQLMRLGALALVSAVAGCSSVKLGAARASHRDYRDATVAVVSPRVDARVTVGDRVSVGAYWTMDVVTAATPVAAAPDFVTRATEYVERRHEVGAPANWQVPPRTTLTGTLGVSDEPDYRASFAGADVSVETEDRRNTLGGGLRLSIDAVGRADDPEFSESLRSMGLSALWGRVLSSRVVTQLVYSLERRDGYQANPYRLVPIWDASDDRPRHYVPERAPDERTRHALEGTGVVSLSLRASARASYRYYADDWGIVAHTASVESWQSLRRERWRLRQHARGHTQGGARFFGARYEGTSGLLTGDPRFGAMRTLTLGGRIDHRITEPIGVGVLVVGLSYDAILFRYQDYPVRRGMLANVFGVSVGLEGR